MCLKSNIMNEHSAFCCLMSLGFLAMVSALIYTNSPVFMLSDLLVPTTATVVGYVNMFDNDTKMYTHYIQLGYKVCLYDECKDNEKHMYLKQVGLSPWDMVLDQQYPIGKEYTMYYNLCCFGPINDIDKQECMRHKNTQPIFTENEVYDNRDIKIGIMGILALPFIIKIVSDTYTSLAHWCHERQVYNRIVFYGIALRKWFDNNVYKRQYKEYKKCNVDTESMISFEDMTVEKSQDVSQV